MRERPLANGGHASRDGDRRQATASRERRKANGGHTIGNRDRRQTVVTRERIRANGGQLAILAKYDGGKFVTIIKYITTDSMSFIIE